MDAMTYALLATIIFQAVAWLVYLDRSSREHARLVADLCQRLQAPEVAVAQHAHFEDGEEFPMADEDLAEQEERARVLAFITKHESGGEP